MAKTASGAQLRTALAKYREVKPYGKYPRALRDEAAAYCRERHKEGLTAAHLAEELGVNVATTSVWIAPDRSRFERAALTAPAKSASGLSLVPVVVRPEPSSSRMGRLEVEFPDGTRLAASGIGARELLEAIESLRRSR
jgi:hypothetical protein